MIHVPDTNVLLRFAYRPDPQHAVVLSAVKKLKDGGDKIHILPQNCVEFWNVFTRPAARNGFGLSIQQTNHSLRLVENFFSASARRCENSSRMAKIGFNFQRFGRSGSRRANRRRNARSSNHAYSDFQRFRFHALFNYRYRRG